MQNFKMIASEYLRCAPKYTISRLNNQNFSGEGAQPPPQTPSPGGEGDTPSPHPTPLGTFGARPPHSKILAAPLSISVTITDI